MCTFSGIFGNTQQQLLLKKPKHEITIQRGITCMKSFVICASQLGTGVLLKKLKYFEVMLNIFEFSSLQEMEES